MSSSRWLAVGSALLALGSLLLITWLAYVWQSKAHFWSWPSLSGIAIGSLGFIIMIIGWIMPEKKSTTKQIQINGDRSTNLQAGGDIKLSVNSKPGEPDEG